MQDPPSGAPPPWGDYVNLVNHFNLHEKELRQAPAKYGYLAGEYALFLTTGEGKFLPISTPDDEVEEISGYILDKTGQIAWFWFGWDAEREEPAVKILQYVKPQPYWVEDPEYLNAVISLGISKPPWE